MTCIHGLICQRLNWNFSIISRFMTKVILSVQDQNHFCSQNNFRMGTIKFVSKNIHEQQFAAAVRKNVNQYFSEKGISTKGNRWLWIQTIAMLCIYLVPFAMILLVPMNVWRALLMSVLMGIGMAGIGMCVMHDAVHGS